MKANETHSITIVLENEEIYDFKSIIEKCRVNEYKEEMFNEKEIKLLEVFDNTMYLKSPNE